jgi:hypothetical protein
LGKEGPEKLKKRMRRERNSRNVSGGKTVGAGRFAGAS